MSALVNSPAQQIRYVVACGILLADDYFTKVMTPDQLARVDMTGAWIVRIRKPRPCLFITFGAGGSFLPGEPCVLYTWISRSMSEQVALGAFMNDISPPNVRPSNLRVMCYHIDLVEAQGQIIRRPTDEEIARMDLHARSLPGDERRVAREVRAVGKRRAAATSTKDEKQKKKRKKQREAKAAKEEEELVKELFGSDEADLDDCEQMASGNEGEEGSFDPSSP